MQNEVVGLTLLGDPQDEGNRQHRPECEKEFELGTRENEVQDTEKHAEHKQIHDLKSQDKRLFFKALIDPRRFKARHWISSSLVDQRSDETYD